MTELEVKLVKVDNWGIFFLQRLKHFFNRTDYCDLTLQFQDNAQLKVHRLVLSACTEYFELLERTCEMYEDCLVMPDDLQADVVVPIVNFMYTGQLEFRMDLLERLYQTSQIMNMTILTKLLEAHRTQVVKPTLNHSSVKRSYSKSRDSIPKSRPAILSHAASSNQVSNKRSHSKAFGNTGNTTSTIKEPKTSMISLIPENTIDNNLDSTFTVPKTNKPLAQTRTSSSRKVALSEPRPTRYELPEELDSDNIFDNSFTNISYSSQPLLVHPDSTKKYKKTKTPGIFDEPSHSGTVDIVECKQIPKREHIFDDDEPVEPVEAMESVFVREPPPKDTNLLFDQIVEPGGPKVTIETKDSKQASNIDHAKIISEVLKKYPHLVKSNKNIKLKILNTPNQNKSRSKKQSQISPLAPQYEKPSKTKPGGGTAAGGTGFIYESDVLDSQEAARLIALGAENTKGPWICLICGAPGKAIHFVSYYKFRRHLVEIHNEKPILNMCEYCGLKSSKRNYLLHHLLTKHGVEPPPAYHFPKCNSCSYIALTEGLLIKHKLSHGHENGSFKCNVCVASYNTSKELLAHIQTTGHKYVDKKTNLQCIYCLKAFLREGNLFAHLKTYHKQLAKNDGILDDSDDEKVEAPQTNIKFEPQSYEESKEDDDDGEPQYQIRPDGNIEMITKKPTGTKQKILNTRFNVPQEKPIQKVKSPVKNIPQMLRQGFNEDEEIVMIGNNEYIMRDNHLFPRKKSNNDFILPEIIQQEQEETLPSEFNLQAAATHNLQDQRMLLKNATNLNQQIQIVVSNEEEYKALMNSNHSIIFDNGDANKTLTVLSAPHSASMNPATLELDNNQSNDMMIIQDDYPMTVSQAIPTDNSNIVVVYSHPVDEENKQFQLITSQDIGSHLAQSSAVITQNFSTVTTSAPNIHEQAVDRQIVESWQNAISEENEGNAASNIHEMAIIDHPEMSAVELVEQNTLHELPEVTLTSAVITRTENIVTLSQNSEALPQDVTLPETITEIVSQDIISKNQPDEQVSENVVVNETEITNTESSSTNLVDSASEEMFIADTVTEKVCLSNENIASQEDLNETTELTETYDSVNIHVENIVEDSAKQTLDESSENVNDENIDSRHEEQDGSDNDKLNNSSGNVDNVEAQNETVGSDLNIMNPLHNVTPTVNTNTPEKIQSLTSEWSEDEDDAGGHSHIEENADKSTPPQLTQPQDMEESIENIQQEMEKQIGDSSQPEALSDVSPNVEQEPPADKLPNENETLVSDIKSQEKISSLLNDWDENDSQEGNESANDAEQTLPPEASNSVEPEQKQSNDTNSEKVEQKKDSKIQSLVSDWDDDEEEKE